MQNWWDKNKLDYSVEKIQVMLDKARGLKAELFLKWGEDVD